MKFVAKKRRKGRRVDDYRVSDDIHKATRSTIYVLSFQAIQWHMRHAIQQTLLDDCKKKYQDIFEAPLEESHLFEWKGLHIFVRRLNGGSLEVVFLAEKNKDISMT